MNRVGVAVLLLALLGSGILFGTRGGAQRWGVPLLGGYRSGMSFVAFQQTRTDGWELAPVSTDSQRVVVIPNVRLWGTSGELRLRWHLDQLMETRFFPPEEEARSVFETAMADLGVVLDMDEESDDMSSRSPRTVDDGDRVVWIWPTAYGRWYIGAADSHIRAEHHHWVVRND